MAELGTDKTPAADLNKIADLAAAIKETASPALPGDVPGLGTVAAPGREHKQVSPEQKAAALAGVGELLALPGETLHAMTGKDRWLITDREKDLLEKKGQAGLLLMLETNPEQLTKQMFYATLGVVYGPRLIAEIRDLIREFRKPVKEEKS